MKRYLIIKCAELSNTFECDANRTPICLTNDFDKFNRYGYEIYEVQKNGEFKLIKDYGRIF